MTELIEHLNERIGDHPQVVNSPIFNETLLVPDPELPGNKIRVSKLILQISILEIRNDLISESIVYQFKEAIYETTGKPLISDISLCELMPNNVPKITDSYKHMCG